MASRCFDSDDDDGSLPPPPSGAGASAPPSASTRPAAPQSSHHSERAASALYSDEEDAVGTRPQPVAAAKAMPKVPQFKRQEWQPPPSQLPGGGPAQHAAPIPQQQPQLPTAQQQQSTTGQPTSASAEQRAKWQVPPPQWTQAQPAQQPSPATSYGPPPSSQPHQPGPTALVHNVPTPRSSTAAEPTSTTPTTASSVAWEAPSQPPQQQQAPAMPIPSPLGSEGVAEPRHANGGGGDAAPALPSGPVPFVAPALSVPALPAHSALPQVPQQRQPAMTTLPPVQSTPPPSALPQHMHAAINEAGANSWEAFQNLRKQLDESHQRTLSLHQQISQLQLTHEKEATAYRDAASGQIEQQRNSLQVITEHYNEAQLKIESLTTLLGRKADHIVKVEQKLHEATVNVTAMMQKAAHMEDRVKLSDSARQVAEVRVRELDLTLEHSAQLVDTLRKQLSGSHDDKARAMQQQYELFEQNRKELVAFFNGREQHMVQNYSTALQDVQAMMEARMIDREAKVGQHWEGIIAEVRVQYERLQRDVNVAREEAHREVKEYREKILAERLKTEAEHEKDIATLEQRFRDREEHAMADIARRERELGEREQKFRVQRAQDEQDAKVALLTKEAELKAYYEKMVDDLRNGHEKDRDRLCTAFRDQITQLSAQHLNNERELERMHREKEREMAQRYRVAGYEMDDRKGQLDLTDVTSKTQNSLLSKFDSIESRQRERAEMSRAALRGSTSLSGVGVPPAAPTSATSSSSDASPPPSAAKNS